MHDGPVSSDTRASAGMVVLLLAAVVYFGAPVVWSGVPPSYVRVGPLEFGAIVNTTCHGVRAGGEMVVEICK